jgi:diacylglycerol O-acyltransferase
MSNGNGNHRKQLSAGDSLFLYLEREASPMTVAGAMEFEGTLRLNECLAFVQSKLPLIPRYTERLAFPALNSAYPVWEPDPHFDIRNHVREVTLREGTEAEFKSVVSDILSTVLDRSQPLWDITLVHGMKGRTGVLARVHHCLVDGIAGVGLMKVLMDSNPNAEPAPRQKKRATAADESHHDVAARLIQLLVTTYLGAIQSMLQVQKEVLDAAEIVAHAGRTTLEQMVNVAPEIVMPAERLPFNKLCRGPQKFAWCSVPLKSVLAVKERAEATLNDVVLSTMTLAVRKYAEVHKVRLKDRLLRIMIPVNVRGNDDVSELGNRISFAPVNIPMDSADPRELMEEVKLRMHHIKATHLAEYVGMAGMLITSLPIPIQALTLPYAGLLPISLSNLICTNVPGPPVPLYFMGHKMLTWYPHVPIGGEMGINTAVLTYDGRVYFGFTIDVYAAPDGNVMEQFVPEAFAELRSAYGVRDAVEPKRRSAPRRKRTASPKPKSAAEPEEEKPLAAAATV